MVFIRAYDSAHYALMTGVRLGSAEFIKAIRPCRPSYLYRAAPHTKALEEEAAWAMTARAHALAHARRLTEHDPKGIENLKLPLDTWVVAPASPGKRGRYDSWFQQHDALGGYKLLIHRGPSRPADYKTLSLWRGVYEHLKRYNTGGIQRVPTRPQEVPDAHLQLQELLEAFDDGEDAVTRLIRQGGHECWHQYLRT